MKRTLDSIDRRCREHSGTTLHDIKSNEIPNYTISEVSKQNNLNMDDEPIPLFERDEYIDKSFLIQKNDKNFGEGTQYTKMSCENKPEG